MKNKTVEEIIEKPVDFAVIRNKLVRSHSLWKTTSDPIEKNIIVGFNVYLNGKIKSVKTWKTKDAPKDYKYDYHIVWDGSYGSTPVFVARDTIVFAIASRIVTMKSIDDFFKSTFIY